MYPTTGQGGSQSLEDAGALGVILRNLLHKDQVPERLKIMDKVRKERIGIVQAMSVIEYGAEEEFMKAHPKHPIHLTRIKNGEDHVKFLYE
jgi:salicylate hydroxylase